MTETPGAPKRSPAEIIAAAKAAKAAKEAAAGAAGGDAAAAPAPAAPAPAAAAPAPAQTGGSTADIIARAKAAAAAKAAAGGTAPAVAAPATAPVVAAGGAPAGGAADIIAKAKAAAAAKAAAGGTGAAAGGTSAAAAAPVAAAPKAPLKPPVPKSGAVPVAEDTPKDGVSQARRKFVFASVFGFIGICSAATARFFFPRVLFEPKTSFKVGRLSDFGIGVSTKFQQQNRIWVVRDSSNLYVILAICTHLGCTPDWKESENKFKCPCHGSGFDTEGVNFEGPAPRPMDRCHVEIDPSGEIVVDKARVYGPKDWKKTGAFLPA